RRGRCAQHARARFMRAHRRPQWCARRRRRAPVRCPADQARAGGRPHRLPSLNESMAYILIVEDDDNSAEMLAALVTDAGHTASIATDLQQARQQLVLHGPDLVLLDLHLPDGSGLDLFSDERLRGDADIVLITGQASVDTSVQALRLGAADYLVKPINLDRLRRVLDRLTSSPRPHRPVLPTSGVGKDVPADNGD